MHVERDSPNRRLWNVGSGPRGSLRFDARELDHLGPFFGVCGDEPAEVSGRTFRTRINRLLLPTKMLLLDPIAANRRPICCDAQHRSHGTMWWRGKTSFVSVSCSNPVSDLEQIGEFRLSQWSKNGSTMHHAKQQAQANAPFLKTALVLWGLGTVRRWSRTRRQNTRLKRTLRPAA